MAGFLPLSRSIFEHDFWQEKRPFSKFEAWLDLLQSARFEKEEAVQWVSGKPIKYGRGQLTASIRYLKERWNWGSITKVEQFLKKTATRTMISLEKGQGQLVITICNYETYNIIKETEKTGKGQQQGRKQGDKKDKSNKVNKEEEISAFSFEDFITEFNNLTGKKTRGCVKSKINFPLRIKEKYSKSDFTTAIKNCLNDKFHIENPDYLTPEFITRSDKLEKYLNAKSIKKTEPIEHRFAPGTSASLFGELKPEYQDA